MEAATKTKQNYVVIKVTGIYMWASLQDTLLVISNVTGDNGVGVGGGLHMMAVERTTFFTRLIIQYPRSNIFSMQVAIIPHKPFGFHSFTDLFMGDSNKMIRCLQAFPGYVHFKPDRSFCCACVPFY